ncbi:unnamed protein product [Tenebrio molitor]|nr:unnamed protein product [Tenebrio molitor]
MHFTFCFIFLLIKYCKSDTLKVTDQVYFDVECDGIYLGRIIIGLFGEVVPKTVLNFKHIATNGISDKTYEGTRFHRVIERFMIQGGDIIHNNGTGSISIYGKFFEDENFKVRHKGPGIVSMANGGPDTNGCQFFVTTMRTPWLDGFHVAFGKVLMGQDIIHKIEHMKTNTDNRPIKDVIIIRSGLVKMTRVFYETDEPYELTLWGWIKAGWFPISFSVGILIFFHWFMIQLK